MPDFLTLNDLPLRGKTVLLRADLNVPTKNGAVSDNARIERLLPTLRDLAKENAKIVVLSHFGRPAPLAEGAAPDPKFSLRPAAAELERLWGQPVAFAEDCIGPKAEAAVKALQPGHILVLENTRFHGGEEKNDPAFAQALAALGDLYVDDAFSCAHRAHASTEGVAHLLPSCAGRLMQAELETLNLALGNPERPLGALVGGSKISTKLDLLNNLVAKVDILVLGGAMANIFLAAKGVAIGKSMTEADMYDTARDIMKKAEARGCYIVTPKDAVVASEVKEGIETQIVDIKNVPEGKMILDVGPETVKEIKECFSLCKTVVWNGPLGVFEVRPFDKGTTEVAIFVADLTKRGKLMSVAGGGDTGSALTIAGVTYGMSYLSTAGGAFLEWLEGKVLPGVAVLKLSLPTQKTAKVIM